MVGHFHKIKQVQLIFDFVNFEFFHSNFYFALPQN